MDEQKLKQIIRQAIFNAHNTHGKQAPGDRLYIAMDVDQGNVIANAVYDALKAAGAFAENSN
jgi:hypothetical protein